MLVIRNMMMNGKTPSMIRAIRSKVRSCPSNMK
jgi:hypothetical protein